ncbi:WW domain binding protein VOPP1 isoform X1 [Macaca fascicularis]
MLAAGGAQFRGAREDLAGERRRWSHGEPQPCAPPELGGAGPWWQGGSRLRSAPSSFLRFSHPAPTLRCTEAKKHCWYFEGLYPTYYICRSYEDCCGSRCCVRALSIQRLWYFWFLLMMGVLFCCGAGFFIRRRMYPPPLIEEPAFNVSYTRQPPNLGPGAQQPGPPYYTDPGGPGMNPVGNSMAMAFQVPPNSPQGSVACPPPPAYCNTPPPPYEQVVKAK